MQLNTLTEQLKEYALLTSERQENPHLSHAPLWELQDAIVKQYLKDPFPELFGNVKLGISIGCGWIEIFSGICNQITEITKQNPDFHVSFIQVKEKFGTLRAYTRIWSTTGAINEHGEVTITNEHKLLRQKVENLISEAESKSYVTCSICGNLGVLRTNGWRQVLCNTHYIKSKRRQNDNVCL